MNIEGYETMYLLIYRVDLSMVYVREWMDVWMYCQSVWVYGSMDGLRDCMYVCMVVLIVCMYVCMDRWNVCMYVCLDRLYVCMYAYI